MTNRLSAFSIQLLNLDLSWRGSVTYIYMSCSFDYTWEDLHRLVSDHLFQLVYQQWNILTFHIVHLLRFPSCLDFQILYSLSADQDGAFKKSLKISRTSGPHHPTLAHDLHTTPERSASSPGPWLDDATFVDWVTVSLHPWGLFFLSDTPSQFALTCRLCLAKDTWWNCDGCHHALWTGCSTIYSPIQHPTKFILCCVESHTLRVQLSTWRAGAANPRSAYLIIQHNQHEPCFSAVTTL